jgi:hypothetical protein
MKYLQPIAARALLLSAVTLSVPIHAASGAIDPLRFFAGVTETIGTTKVVLHKAIQTRSTGRGQIEPDGSLVLVQRVQDAGQAPYIRKWQIRRIAPGRYSGTMSQANGPVTIEQVGNRYRFTFKMSGNMSVEQWLTPLTDGLSAASRMTVRKFGLTVASSTALVRKLP